MTNCNTDEVINIPLKKVRFCEAVSHSFEIPLLINKQNIGCVGAARNLGFHPQTDDEIRNHISENTGIPREFVGKMLANTPPIHKSLTNVYMGITEAMEEIYKPEFFIVYANPLKVMQLIHDLARKQQRRPFIAAYSLLSICGNVFARGYNSDTVCISFGCPESRRYGGVDKDEVVIGFTERFIHEFFS